MLWGSGEDILTIENTKYINNNFILNSPLVDEFSTDALGEMLPII